MTTLSAPVLAPYKRDAFVSPQDDAVDKHPVRASVSASREPLDS